MQYIAGHSLDKVLADVKRLKREIGVPARNQEWRPIRESNRPARSRTTADASPLDASLRSVSIGLLRGMFDSGPPASTEGQRPRQKLSRSRGGHAIRRQPGRREPRRGFLDRPRRRTTSAAGVFQSGRRLRLILGERILVAVSARDRPDRLPGSRRSRLRPQAQGDPPRHQAAQHPARCPGQRLDH